MTNKAVLYRGAPCKRCGNTVRYKSWNSCVPCERKRQRNKKRPLFKNESLMWLKPILVDGVKIKFSPTERDVFMVLFNARGEQVSTNRIIDAVWGNSDDPPLNMQSSISVVIHRIRLAMEPTRFRIRNDWGRGYRLERLSERNSSRGIDIAA